MAARAQYLLEAIDSFESKGGGIVYHVQSYNKENSFYIGRCSRGNAVLLVATSTPSERAIPLQLSGIEVNFDITCKISESGAETRANFTVVRCLSADQIVEAYFCHIADIIIDELGDYPKATEVEASINQLVSLFEQLKSPPRKNVQGLLGELLVIDAADSVDGAVSSWHRDPSERFDFAGGNVRLEAKTWSNGPRRHTFSSEQVNLPEKTVGVLASAFIEESGGGVTLAKFLDAIELRLTHVIPVTHFRLKIAETLGLHLVQAKTYCFDLARARSTLAFYDIDSLPAIRPPHPAGVSAISFTSDLAHVAPLSLQQVNSIVWPELRFSIGKKAGSNL